MTLLALLGSLAMVGTIGGLLTKQTWVVVIGAIFWFLFAAQCYTLSTAANDVYWITFFASMFIGVVTLSGGLIVWRRGRSNITDYGDELDDDVDRYIEEEQSERNRVRRAKGLGRKKKSPSLRL